ncbi:MAG: FAD-dependent oxidoreductase [Nanoarchaeota archaeon]
MKFVELEAEIVERIIETLSVITLKCDTHNNFDYLPGHYIGIDLRSSLSDYQLIKAFSLASSPTELPYIMITFKKGESPFKKKLESLKVGDKIKIKGPYGNFLFQNDFSKTAIMIAGGIGITPFRGMIKYATDKKLPAKIKLLYSSKTQDEIAFFKELEELKKINKNLEIKYTLTRDNNNGEWNGSTGRINEKVIKDNIDINNSIFYICGTPSMVEDMIAILKNIGIKEEDIRYEKFTGYK